MSKHRFILQVLIKKMNVWWFCNFIRCNQFIRQKLIQIYFVYDFVIYEGTVFEKKFYYEFYYYEFKMLTHLMKHI